MKKRRGFTLSELLVVVVIIGVLSAVVLPKFSKVIETRKTTEAEELMSAVRTEQEARCTLSKSYTASKDSLGSYKDGKYFNYDLGTVGMTARATSGEYKLEMPSYADGRICCSDIEIGACNNLNKNYPLCKDLVDISKTPDYVAGNENCEVELEDGKESSTESEDPECVSGTTEEKACSNNCGETGIQKNQCIGGKWQGWGACSVSDRASCGNEPPTNGNCTDGETKSAGETGDGCADIQVTCKNGEWDYSSLEWILKEGNECFGQQTKDGMSCVQCKWNAACTREKARTKWNASANRCECPGAYDYYVAENDACCSYQTPKTDTKCWKAEAKPTWTWQEKSSETQEFFGQTLCGGGWSTEQCRYVLDCPEAAPDMVCQGDNSPYRGSSGQSCVYKCEEKYVDYKASFGEKCCSEYSGCTRTKLVRTLYQVVCLPKSNDTSYSPLWDPKEDKKY